jgi:Kdo2-lipid IVA lauroyltransferase/acyltransferase
MRVLYLLSDISYFLLYYVIGYRKNIVMDNLAIAFPNRSEKERIAIAREFYLNFADNFIEAIKLVSASKSFLTSHFKVDNPELIQHYFDQGRKCQLHLGHNFNWEMANMVMPYYTGYHFLVVYMPIENRILDRIFRKIRSRTGTGLLSAMNLSRSILSFRKTQYMLTLVADQAPAKLSSSYWSYFFGRATPFMQTPEKGARIADIPVLFGRIYKTKRGYYRAGLAEGSGNPASLPEGELTRRYIHFLEETIGQYPSLWLWTHRRWKHDWKPENRKNWIGERDPPSD